MASSSSNNSAGKILKRANPSTIHEKFLVGYQGWFTCAGDGEPVGPGHHGWLHWFNHPIPDGGRPNTDVWPDVSSYSPSELFPAPGLKSKTGEPVFLFSSRNPKTVQRHFHWMAEHGVDGAFLQRFAGQCDLEAGNEGIMRIRDEVGDRVREAAEREGRVFAIMYDVSGVAPDRIESILQRDWNHLVRNKGVLDSPNYLKEKGKPVIALWGFGFDNSKHTPALVRSIIQFFRDTTPGGVYIMGGTPASWRTADGDADRNPEFLDVWLQDFDAISPWTIGRYSTEKEADAFFETKMKGDFDLISQRNAGSSRKVDYIPVVLPGGSGFNLSEGKWGFNDIKRRGGRFLWQQIANSKRLGVRTIYGAMWDEYDEGTAFMPIVEHKRGLPDSDKFRFLALDEDGYDVPSDWYMRICGFAAEGLRSERRIFETFPVKELQDYWSSRPKYEEFNQKSGEFLSGAVAGGSGASGSNVGSSEADGQTYEEWLAAQKEDKEELPPPPYTLEVNEEEPVSIPVVQNQPVAAAASAVASTAAVISSSPTDVSINLPTMTTATPQLESSTPIGGPPILNTGNYPPSGYPGPSSISPGSNHQSQDPINALAQDLRQQGILDSPATESGSNLPASVGGGRLPTGSPPPLHPAHPAAQNAGTAAHPGRQTRPPSQSRPSLPARPASQQGYPQRPTGPAPGTGAAPTPVQEAPASGPWAQGQWPPQEWRGPSNHAAPAPSVPQSTYSGAQGGANLTRPQSFSAQHPANTANQTPPVPAQPTYPGVPGGVNLNRPQSFSANANAVNQPPPAPQSTYPAVSGGASLNRPQSFSAPLVNSGNQTPTVPPSTYPLIPGGANLTRPQSVSASHNIVGAGASLRPSSTIGGRPSSALSNPITSLPGSYPTNEQHSPSSYPAPHTQGPPDNFGPGSYPQHNASPYAPGAGGPPLHGHGHYPMNFPNAPSASPYTPPTFGYAGQGPNFPGQLNNSYQSMPGSNFPWSGGSPHTSPPHSPHAVGSTFPGQLAYDSRPYNPTQGPTQSQYPPSFPSGTSPPMGPEGGGIYFPQAQGPGGDYGGGSGNVVSMPGASSPTASGYGPPYMGQYGPSSSSPYPGQAGPFYPQPAGPSSGPWMPPAIPPRPSTTQPVSSYGRPSGSNYPMASNAGSGALGFALDAVDKVAGKKRRDQLETSVGSLAQTSSKLFNKYMK